MPLKDKNARREYARRYFSKNKAVRLAYIKKWKQDNKEKVLATGRVAARRYYRENKETVLQRGRIYRKANQERFRAYARASYRRHKDRWRNRSYIERFGLSLADVNAIKEAQGGICAVRECGREATHLDHDHNSGKVRAMLCGGCNTALGLLYEDVNRAIGLTEYMRDHGCLPTKEIESETEKQGAEECYPLFDFAATDAVH